MRRTPGARAESCEQNDVIEAYVAELRSYLRGPAMVKSRVVEEIAVDLESAIGKFRRLGLDASEAAAAAVAEMGQAMEVAEGFADELAIAEARATLRSLLITGPLVGFWWLMLLAPAGWMSQPGELIAAIPILPAVAMAVAAGVLTLATTGSLIRWLPASPPRRAILAAASVGTVCVAADLLVLTTLTVRLASGSGGSIAVGLVPMAAIASLVRLPFAVWATSRCLCTRSLLPPVRPLTT